MAGWSNVGRLTKTICVADQGLPLIVFDIDKRVRKIGRKNLIFCQLWTIVYGTINYHQICYWIESVWSPYGQLYKIRLISSKNADAV